MILGFATLRVVDVSIELFAVRNSQPHILLHTFSGIFCFASLNTMLLVNRIAVGQILWSNLCSHSRRSWRLKMPALVCVMLLRLMILSVCLSHGDTAGHVWAVSCDFLLVQLCIVPAVLLKMLCRIVCYSTCILDLQLMTGIILSGVSVMACLNCAGRIVQWFGNVVGLELHSAMYALRSEFTMRVGFPRCVGQLFVLLMVQYIYVLGG